MAYAFLAAFSSAEVCGIKLFAFNYGVFGGVFERGDDFCAVEVRSAYFNGLVIADEQDLA